MSVKVYNFNYFKDLPKVIEASISDVTIAGLVEHLESEFGAQLSKTLIVDGKLAQRARVSINGNQVDSLDAIVPDGGQLMFSLMLPGG